MKITKRFITLLLIILAVSLLTACAGGAGVPNSWPGITLDSEAGLVYLAKTAHIYAVNLSTGSEKWRYPQEPNNKVSFYAAPELTEDGQLVAGGYDNNLYSINAESGQQNWIFEGASDKYVGSSLALGGAIYAPNVNYFLYALSTNGSLSWNFESAQAIWAKPILKDGKLFAASMDHHVYAIDPENGTEIWMTEDLGGAIVSSFVLGTDGVIYVGTLGSNLSAVDVSNGSVLWTTPAKGWVWTKPVLAGDLLFFGDQDGNVYALDAQSGSMRWEIKPDTGPDRAVISSPVVHENTLYFASQAGILYAVDAATGNAIWNKPIGGKIYSDLVLAGDTILIAPLDIDQTLIAVDLQGNNRWTYTPAK